MTDSQIGIPSWNLLEAENTEIDEQYFLLLRTYKVGPWSFSVIKNKQSLAFFILFWTLEKAKFFLWAPALIIFVKLKFMILISVNLHSLSVVLSFILVDLVDNCIYNEAL